MPALLGAGVLMRGGGAQRCIEGDVGFLRAGRPGHDVAPAFAVGARLGAATALTPRQAIDLAFQTARGEDRPDFDFVAPFPPTRRG
jgi:hypothetical protein